MPWWPPERRDVTLQLILIHVIAETNRHAGHADIVRELIDGAAGLRADNSNLPDRDAAWWETYRARVERAARGRRPEPLTWQSVGSMSTPLPRSVSTARGFVTSP